MTQGLIDNYYRNMVVTSDQGSAGWVGIYSYKSWSGTDRVRTYKTVQVRRQSRPSLRRRKQDDGTYVFLEVPRPDIVYAKRIYDEPSLEPHPYSVTYKQYKHRLLSYKNRNSGANWVTTDFPTVPSFPSFATLWNSNDDIAMVSKLGERISGSDFSPALFLAEAGQSLSLIGERATRLAKSIAYFRKGSYQKAYQAALGHQRANLRGKTHADFVLEVQYGWRPLLSDMQSGAEWLAAHLEREPYFRFAVRRTREWTLPANYSSASGLFFSTGYSRVRKQIVAYISPDSGNVDLNLYTLPQVLYEKTPWSFVLDWAFPIGEYLNAKGIASATKGKFIVTTKYEKFATGVKPSPNGSLYTKTTTFKSDGKPSFLEGSVVRVIQSSLENLVNLPTYKGFSKMASYEHCVNALALLASNRGTNPDVVLRRAGSSPYRQITS